MKKAFSNSDKIFQPLTVRVPLEQYRKLKHIAVDKDLSLAELGRKIIAQFLKDYEKSKE